MLIAGGNGTDEHGQHGSLLSAELFDPRTGTFEATGQMSSPRGWQRLLSAAIAATAVRLPDGRIVVSGGLGGEVTDDVYDPKTGRFTAAHTAAEEPSDGPWILGVECRFPCLHRFDPESGLGPLSTRAAPINGGTFGARAFNGGSTWLLTGDRLLVMTGADVALYDLATGDVSQTGSVVASYRRSASATALADGSVLIAGGTDSTDEATFVTGAAEIAGPTHAE